MPNDLVELSGTVESVIFASADGRFAVFRLQPEGESGTVVVTVASEAPLLGQAVTVGGEWVVHPRFGEQLKASRLRLMAPTSLAGIERFLASGAVKGIGPAVAKRLVKKFGVETLDVMEHKHHLLQQVPGIGPKTAEKIYQSYISQAELRDIMLWLEQRGVSGMYAARLYKRYGSFALEVLEQNPYRLAQEVSGIGFLTADAIAKANDMAVDDEARLSAGIDYALSTVAASGHCCLPERVLAERAAQLLQVKVPAVREVLSKRLQEGSLQAETVGGATLVYPMFLYEAEKESAEILRYLIDYAEPLAVTDPEELVADWEERAEVELAAEQRQAIETALTQGVFVLTGGPGTGKTTVVRGIIEVLESLSMVVALGAPTGRAAKRLSEATGKPAQTIHRLLEAKGGEAGDDGESFFSRDEDEPLEADVIILDEVSMLDIVLLRHFLAAVPKGCHLILVGDADQLPAVGPGAVLKDILRSGVVPSVRLQRVFRQAEESVIVRNAHAINAGRLPECRPGTSFEFRETHSDVETSQAVVQLCCRELVREGRDVLTEVQVLSPMHRQECGVDNLNHLLQEALNPSGWEKPEKKAGNHVYRLGDKVMQIRNDYTKNVFNGDIGFVTRVTPESLRVRYSDELTADYENNELGSLVPAYAMSVHKSQGGEYPIIILPLVPAHSIMLQRNLLYTAVTRARDRVILLGSKAALFTAVSNDKTTRRLTLLAERLGERLE